MKNPHLLAYALSTPWAMMPERMAAYASVLVGHFAGDRQAVNVEKPPEMQAAAAASKGRQGGVAVIPVFGGMVEWPHEINMCDGGASTLQIGRALADAEADETVDQVLMVFGTPGGSVYGTSELAAQINRVKSKKPVIGVAQSLAASAGYWALSQCTEAYCSPGGEVGSIGVYSGHEDISKALEMAGISVELFSAGDFKTEMAPFAPLSEEARVFQKKRAAEYYSMFTKSVAKGRNVPIDAVRNGMGRGRVLGAEEALSENMIDGIASMDEVLSRMRKPSRPQRTSRAATYAAAIQSVS